MRESRSELVSWVDILPENSGHSGRMSTGTSCGYAPWRPQLAHPGQCLHTTASRRWGDKMTGSRGGLRETVVPFIAGDGMQCNLVHVEGERAPAKGPVMLVHGAGVRANIFRAPIPVTIVDDLVANGYDVWLENWRASIDLPPNPWTLDQAAVHDHPAAIATIRRATGADRVKAIVHCQGSCSFVMSALAGLVPEVDSIVSNAVSIHTVVPPGSRLKLDAVLPAVRLITPYLNPHWGKHAPTMAAKLVTFAGAITHSGCDNAV